MLIYIKTLRNSRILTLEEPKKNKNQTVNSIPEIFFLIHKF